MEDTPNKRTKPKGSGRKALPKRVKKNNRKESIKSYREGRKAFTCMIDPKLWEELKNVKDELDLSYKKMLEYFLDLHKENKS